MAEGDDERPISSGAVPGWQGRGFWNRMARSIRVTSPTVLEVKNLTERRVRVLCFFAFLLFALMPVVNSVLSGRPPLDLYQRMIDSIELTFFPHRALVESYEQSMSLRDEVDRIPYAQFVADYIAWRPLGGVIENLLMNLLWPAILLGLAWCAFFFPANYPMRVDREKRLIYTQRGRHLYVKTLPYTYPPGHDWRDKSKYQDQYEGWWMENTIPLLSRRAPSDEVLAVEMHRIDRPEKTRKFRLGEYPMTHRRTQGADIFNIIDAFSYQPEPGRAGQVAKPYDPGWQEKLFVDAPIFLDGIRNLAGRSLGRRDRYDEAELDAGLRAYLDRARAG